MLVLSIPFIIYALELSLQSETGFRTRSKPCSKPASPRLSMMLSAGPGVHHALAGFAIC